MSNEDVMRAVVLDAPGPVESLVVRSIPRPVPRTGEVGIRVMGAGINRSELHTRLGLAQGVTFPRVLGVEATGVVDGCPGGEFALGQQVMTMMGGMGRTFDGGYAEFTVVPVGQVIAFESDLDWATLAAVPEMLQTAYGSLTTGMAVEAGDTILVRGGTSSVGMAVAVLAKQRGARVISTTRNAGKVGALEAIGVDEVVIDAGLIADQVRELVPDGVDAAIELVAATTLRDTLRATRKGGVVCFTGMLAEDWIVPDFYPIDFIPTGVRLTAYSGEAADLPAAVLQGFLAEAAEAHRLMEEGSATGKLVLLP